MDAGLGFVCDDHTRPREQKVEQRLGLDGTLFFVCPAGASGVREAMVECEP